MQEKMVAKQEKVEDFFPVKEVDYLEIYSGNARQSCHFFCSAFGFEPVAYSGLETGNRETVSYVLQQRKIRLVITGSLTESSRVAYFDEGWLSWHSEQLVHRAMKVHLVPCSAIESA